MMEESSGISDVQDTTINLHEEQKNSQEENWASFSNLDNRKSSTDIAGNIILEGFNPNELFSEVLSEKDLDLKIREDVQSEDTLILRNNLNRIKIVLQSSKSRLRKRLIDFLRDVTEKAFLGAPEKAVEMILQDNSEGFSFTENLIKTLVRDVDLSLPLVEIYISIMLQLYQKRALPNSFLLSSKISRLFFFLTGATWASRATTMMCHLLVEVTEDRQDLKNTLMKKLKKKIKIDYSFRYYVLNKGGKKCFYKLAKTADKISENPMAKSLLFFGGLIPENRELAKRCVYLPSTQAKETDKNFLSFEVLHQLFKELKDNFVGEETPLDRFEEELIRSEEVTRIVFRSGCNH